MNNRNPADPVNFFSMNSTWIQQLFNSFSTAICAFSHFFAFFRTCLKNPCITYHGCLPNFQTESKGNFESMSLYRHKTLFQPQAIRAKKQTFSNSDCCKCSPLYSELANVIGRGWGVGIAPPTATCVTCAVKTRRAVTSRRRQEACCHFAPPTRGVLSLRAADKAAKQKGQALWPVLSNSSFTDC
jgi:hypothetical protein